MGVGKHIVGGAAISELVLLRVLLGIEAEIWTGGGGALREEEEEEEASAEEHRRVAPAPEKRCSIHGRIDRWRMECGLSTANSSAMPDARCPMRLPSSDKFLLF